MAAFALFVLAIAAGLGSVVALLLDAFFGPEQVATPQPIHHPSERVDDPPEPLFEQARR